MKDDWDNSDYRLRPGRRQEKVYIDLLVPIKWLLYIGLAYGLYKFFLN